MISPRKRTLNATSGNKRAESKRSKKQDAIPADPKQAVLDLDRLLYAMERHSSKPDATALHQIDRAQTLWNGISGYILEHDPEKHAVMQSKLQGLLVNGNRSNVPEAPTAVPATTTTRPSVLEKIFIVKPLAAVPDTNNNNDTAIRNSKAPPNTPTSISPEGSSSTVLPRVAQPPRPSSRQQKQQKQQATVQEIQKEQREQIEQAISIMASQLKDETARIHNTLQGQSVELDHLQEAAQDNVTDLTAVTASVEQHVKSNWKRTVGTWTMLFTMIGVFCACLVAIQMVPKYYNHHQQKACVWFFCKKQEQQFCRTLPNGKRECINEQATHSAPQISVAELEKGDEDEEHVESIQDELEEQDDEQVEEIATLDQQDDDEEKEEADVDQSLNENLKECEVGMDGECVSVTLDSEVEHPTVQESEEQDDDHLEDNDEWIDEEAEQSDEDSIAQPADDDDLEHDHEDQPDDQQAIDDNVEEQSADLEVDNESVECDRDSEGGCIQEVESSELDTDQTVYEEETQTNDERDEMELGRNYEETVIDEVDLENSEQESMENELDVDQSPSEEETQRVDKEDEMESGRSNGQTVVDEVYSENSERMDSELDQSPADEATQSIDERDDIELARSHEETLIEESEQESMESPEPVEHDRNSEDVQGEEQLHDETPLTLDILSDRDEQLRDCEVGLDGACIQTLSADAPADLPRTDSDDNKKDITTEHVSVESMTNDESPPIDREQAQQEKIQDGVEELEGELKGCEVGADGACLRMMEGETLESATRGEEGEQVGSEESSDNTEEWPPEGEKVCEDGQDCSQSTEQDEFKIEIPSADEMRAAALKDFIETRESVENAPKKPEERSASFGGGGFQGMEKTAPSLPVHGGKPFSPKDLRQAAATGDLELLRAYLANAPHWIDRKDKNGWTALHLVSRAGHVDVAEALIAAGADKKSRTKTGETALDIARLRLGMRHPILAVLEQ